MGIRSRLSNRLLSKSYSWAVKKGSLEPMITIDGREIEIEYVDPDNPPEGYSWNGELYHKGGIYLDGYANPIPVEISRQKVEEDIEDLDSDDVRLIPSMEYQTKLDTKVIQDLIGDPNDRLLKMIAAGVALSSVGVLIAIGLIQNGAA